MAATDWAWVIRVSPEAAQANRNSGRCLINPRPDQQESSRDVPLSSEIFCVPLRHGSVSGSFSERSGPFALCAYHGAHPRDRASLRTLSAPPKFELRSNGRSWLGRGLAPCSVGSAYLLLPVSSGSASLAKP